MKKDRLLSGALFFLPIAAILFVYRNVIFFGGIFANQDVIYNYLPYYLSILRGNLVDYGLLGGFPVYITMQATWWSPVTHALLAIVRPENAYILADLGYVTLTYVFAYLFIKRLGMRHEIAILCSATYLFSGQVMLWSHTPLITLYHFTLPATLYLFEVARTSGWLKRALSVVVISALLGLGWISGHVQFNVYVYTLLYAYAFFVLVVRADGRKRGFWHFALFVATTSAISFVIGFPQIDAVLAVTPLTFRAAGVPVAQLYGLGYMPYTIIHYVLPSFRIYYPPVAQSFHNYIGLFSLVVLIFWHTGIGKRLPRIVDSRYRFFVGVFAFCLLISLNKSPLAMLEHFVPFYNSFREAVRMMFMGDFALAIMLGYVLEAMLKARPGYLESALVRPLKWLRRLNLYFIVPGAVAVTIVVVFWFEKLNGALGRYFISHGLKSATGNLPMEHYLVLIRTYLHRDLYQLSLLSVHTVALVVLLCALYFLLRRIGTRSARVFLALAVLFVTVDFSAAYYDRYPAVPKRELFTLSDTEQAIRSNEATSTAEFRYLSVLGSDALWRESVRCEFADLNNWNISAEEFELRKELVDPNFNLYSGLQSADGYEPFMVRHVSDVGGYIGSRLTSSSNDGDIVSMKTLDEKVNALRVRKNALRAENIKYLISAYEIKDPDFREIFSETKSKCGWHMHVYELSHPYPRFFLSNNVKVEPVDYVQNMQTLASSSEPVVIVESMPRKALSAPGAAIALSGKYQGDTITIDLPARKESMYAEIGLTWMPGWKAYADGEPVEVVRANYSEMAVFLSPSVTTLKLQYVPTKYFGSQEVRKGK